MYLSVLLTGTNGLTVSGGGLTTAAGWLADCSLGAELE